MIANLGLGRRREDRLGQALGLVQAAWVVDRQWQLDDAGVQPFGPPNGYTRTVLANGSYSQVDRRTGPFTDLDLASGDLLVPLLGHSARVANYLHEFAHDGRHLLGVPCH